MKSRRNKSQRRASRILGVREVAERLGYHPESIRRLVRQGRFLTPFLKVEGSTRLGWTEEAVEAYIAARERTVA